MNYEPRFMNGFANLAAGARAFTPAYGVPVCREGRSVEDRPSGLLDVQSGTGVPRAEGMAWWGRAAGARAFPPAYGVRMCREGRSVEDRPGGLLDAQGGTGRGE